MPNGRLTSGRQLPYEKLKCESVPCSGRTDATRSVICVLIVIGSMSFSCEYDYSGDLHSRICHPEPQRRISRSRSRDPSLQLRMTTSLAGIENIDCNLQSAITSAQ